MLAGLETTGLLVTHLGSSPATPLTGDTEPPHQRNDDELDATGSRDRYRIHPLMAEVVRRRILAGGVDVDEAKATVLRAVRLDVARGEAQPAFQRLIALNLPDQAAALIASDGHALFCTATTRPFAASPDGSPGGRRQPRRVVLPGPREDGSTSTWRARLVGSTGCCVICRRSPGPAASSPYSSRASG